MRALVFVVALALACCPHGFAQVDTRPPKKVAADLVNAERATEALRVLATLREQAPRDPEVFVWTGEAHFQLEDYEKAAAAFRAAIAIDPAIAPFLQNLGHALLKLQKTKEAREHFQLIVDKSKSPAARARALAGVGTAYAEDGDEKTARAKFEEALKIDPGLDRARYRLALILLKAKESEPAAAHLLAIVKAHPLYEGAAYNLGLAYRALGNDAAAKEWEEKFKQVRKAKKELEDLKLAWKQTGRIELMAAIARVYARAGEDGDALSWFARYLSLKPDDLAARSEADAVKARAGR